MGQFGILIPIIAIIGGLLYAAYEQNVKLKIAQSKANSHKLDDAAAEQIKNLQSRVAVLEKIVTDKSYSLKDEIDSLNKAS